jgi:3-hydroxyacyl-[acyl-carrier-protein] dehydratase
VRFHLIDRLDAWEPGAWVRATKLTSRAEDHWQAGADGLHMPPALVVEAFLQAGTWLVMATTERRRRAALLSIGELRFGGPVVPGDALELHGNVETMGKEVAVLSGTGRVDDRIVLECRDVMCTLIDADALEDPDQVTRMHEVLTRRVAA